MSSSNFSLSRRSALAVTGGALCAALAKPALAQNRSSVLRFVPHANLSTLDPLWSNALVSYSAASMIWERLYGLDDSLTPRPQMVGAHERSEDGLTWRFKLRDALTWHDGTKVTARDCVASLARWMQKDAFGVRLKAQMEEMRAVDDDSFSLRLKKPFPQLLFALGATACFIMPERLAATPASSGVQDYVGSGPFVFRKDEWVSGARAVFERNARYVSRDEKPEFWAGGRPVHFDRVEWHILPDAGTAASALQRGEVDWLERPLTDLLPLFSQNKDIRTEVLDPLGTWSALRFNTSIAPFDNPKVARAVLPLLKQREFLESLQGDRTDLMNDRSGVFLPKTPLASEAGLDKLTGPRDLELAKRLLRESGYDGQPVILLEAADLALSAAYAPVAQQLLEQIGFKVDRQTTDWGTLLARVNSSGSNAPWHCYPTSWAGLWVTNPAMHLHLYGVKRHSGMQALLSEWFEAPDLPAQKQVTDRMQLLAFDEPPFVPCGQFFNVQAFRADLTGFVKSPTPIFWNLRKA